MPRNRCTIAGIAGWIDQTDVNWRDYGGCWFHPPVGDSPEWAAIRLDTPDGDGGTDTYAVAVMVDPAKVKPSDLDTCDVPHTYTPDADGEDRATYAMQRVYAYLATCGASGPMGGETYRNRDPAKARAAAARFLLGAS